MAQMDYNSAMHSAEKRGEILAYANLVRKNKMTIQEAAEEAKVSIKDFAKQTGIKLKEANA